MLVTQCNRCHTILEWRKFEKTCPYCKAPLEPGYRHMDDEPEIPLPEGAPSVREG